MTHGQTRHMQLTLFLELVPGLLIAVFFIVPDFILGVSALAYTHGTPAHSLNAKGGFAAYLSGSHSPS